MINQSEIGEKIFANEIPHILDSLVSGYQYKSVTDRYFSRRYCLEVNGVPKNDYCVLFHSNRICILTLAPSHFLFENDEDFKVNFTVNSVDRTKSMVKGKGKKGGHMLEVSSAICQIEKADGTTFSVPSCVKGKLIEVNENLIKQPNLLRRTPDSDGYIAVLLMPIKCSEQKKDEMIAEPQYNKIMSSN